MKDIFWNQSPEVVHVHVRWAPHVLMLGFCGVRPLLPSIGGCIRVVLWEVSWFQALWNALGHYCGMCQTVPSIVGCVLPLLWNVVCFTKYCGICPGSKHCGMRLTFNVGCVKHYQALWGACYHYCGMFYQLLWVLLQTQPWELKV
jgi:hypothetical protein